MVIENLEQLKALYADSGVERLLVKELASNDNSKNQVYLGGDFSVLGLLPYGDLMSDTSPLANAKKYRIKAPLYFFWLDADGCHRAPNAQLVLYPKYPEVRLSGFLLGCSQAPSKVMSVRDPGRVLFLGITPDGRILAHAVSAGSTLANEFRSANYPMTDGILQQIPLFAAAGKDSKLLLIDELSAVYERGWIPSQKLDANYVKQPYRAQNGGGYTLEAELGIRPNGLAEPDFLGWEVKQFGVESLLSARAKSDITLMTPEPTGGIYRTGGTGEFLDRFGYADRRGVPDRRNFGGRYRISGAPHHLTGLFMVIDGFDCSNGVVTDLEHGTISLRNASGDVAASWDFPGLMRHWERKHIKAVYVPSIKRGPPPEYRYSSRIFLKEGTDFMRFLSTICAGDIVYDPAIKMEHISTSPKVKKRSQFRINFNALDKLYKTNGVIDLN